MTAHHQAIQYRRAGRGDFDAIIHFMTSCFQHKSNYVNPDLFDKQYLSAIYETTSFFVAEQSDALVGLVLAGCNIYYPRAIELGTLIVHPDHRRAGIGETLFQYAIDATQKAGKSILYAHAVMFHAYSQLLLEKSDFKPTGFLYGTVNAEKHLKELKLHGTTHTLVSYVKNAFAIHVGNLFVPAAMQAFTKGIYDTLGVTANFCAEGKPAAVSHFFVNDIPYHSVLHIYLSECGTDLSGCLHRLERGGAAKSESYVAYLNLSHESAIYGAGILADNGYTFSGIKPLCSNCEYMIFCKTPPECYHLDELKTSATVAELLNEVKRIEA